MRRVLRGDDYLGTLRTLLSPAHAPAGVLSYAQFMERFQPTIDAVFSDWDANRHLLPSPHDPDVRAFFLPGQGRFYACSVRGHLAPNGDVILRGFSIDWEGPLDPEDLD